jgi:hypothetical protein
VVYLRELGLGVATGSVRQRHRRRGRRRHCALTLTSPHAHASEKEQEILWRVLERRMRSQELLYCGRFERNSVGQTILRTRLFQDGIRRLKKTKKE